MRLVTDMIEFCAAEMPLCHPISISGYHIREAGSTAAQELAFTLKNGFTYVEWALARGLPVDAFAPRLSFFFNAHIDFFEEIAKFRAARRIWARELRDTYGARDERSLLMRFHTQTAGVSLTWQQPLVNIARTAIEALAAVLGGTQSLHTNSYDEALALPTEDAVRIALRTQQVIAHETGVANAIDPLGGSYHVEALTNRLETEAYALFRRIDDARRDGRGDRAERSPARDRRGRVPLPARGRGGPTGRGRRQPLPRRRRGATAAAPARSSRSSASRPSGSAALRARRDAARVEQRLAAIARGVGERGPQPHAAARRGGARRRHARRDLRHLARRLGHVARAAGVLTEGA